MLELKSLIKAYYITDIFFRIYDVLSRTVDGSWDSI